MSKQKQRVSNQSSSQNGLKPDSKPSSKIAQLIDFSENANLARQSPQPISEEAHQHNLRQERLKQAAVQARQELQRLSACRREAVTNILVASAFSVMAAIALANFLPQYSGQKQKLVQVTTELNQVEKKVEDLREQFPSTFDAGSSTESNLRRNGWFKPSQIPIKIQVNPTEVPK